MGDARRTRLGAPDGGVPRITLAQAKSTAGNGAPGETRTPNLLIRSQMLYPLSYGRLGGDRRNRQPTAKGTETNQTGTKTQGKNKGFGICVIRATAPRRRRRTADKVIAMGRLCWQINGEFDSDEWGQAERP
jgi:hypothetical protein